MPIYAHHTFERGGIAIWRIEETPDELYALLSTSRYDAMLAAISHEARRAEWLAVRVLIAQVLGDDKEVKYHLSGRPFLADGSYHVSISHTKGYAAIAYHDSCAIGIDIEHVAPRVLRIAHRFTHPDEALYIDRFNTDEQLPYLLINWSAKETLYKLLDDPAAADFRETFRIAPYELGQQGTLTAYISLTSSQQIVRYQRCSDFVCTWAMK